MKKEMMKKSSAFIIIVFVLMLADSSNAQDQHFSQYANTPMYINPALTGNFGGTARVTNSYRSQWSALGKGYQTLYIAADAPVGRKSLGNNQFGVGGMVVQDKAGESGFKTTLIEGSLSYTACLNDENQHYFSLGFQAGLNQYSIDLTKATWDSQWNGDTYDPALSSGESIQLQQLTWLDFNAGVLYYYLPDDENLFDIGASMSHIGSPNVSFFVEQETPLRRKITVHSSGEIKLNKSNEEWICPRALFAMQGNQKEILAGAFYKRKLQLKSRYTNYKKELGLNLGGFYRFEDAAIIAAQFEFSTMNYGLGLGVSYDVNTSTLSKLAASSSAFEFNLSYIAFIKKGNKAKSGNLPRFF